MLGDDELRDALSDKWPLEDRLVVMPLLDDDQIGAGSIDLRLATEFIETRRATATVIDPLVAEEHAEFSDEEQMAVPFGESWVLHPGHFVLGATFEFIRMPPHLAGQVLGRSSWARVGLLVATAVVVQPGFAGSLTLELANVGNVPIQLSPGVRIAQLAVWRLGRKAGKPYGDDRPPYSAPLGPQSSRLVVDPEERRRIEFIGKALRGELLVVAAKGEGG